MSAPVILVADRDPLHRQLIDLLLAEDHYVIVGVESGKQTLEYVRENTPDLAILGMDLDDISGADVCEKMKSVTRLNPVPVILTAPHGGTGGLNAHTKSLAHFVGADLVLQKPLGDKNLRQRVENLLAGDTGRSPIDTSLLQSTLAIEKAIDSIETAPEVTAESAAEAQSDAERYALEIATLKATIAELEKQLAGPTTETSSGRNSILPHRVQQELGELRDRVEQQKRIINELKRRNDLLVATIEEEKRKTDTQRGLFGRRRTS